MGLGRDGKEGEPALEMLRLDRQFRMEGKGMPLITVGAKESPRLEISDGLIMRLPIMDDSREDRAELRIFLRLAIKAAHTGHDRRFRIGGLQCRSHERPFDLCGKGSDHMRPQLQPR